MTDSKPWRSDPVTALKSPRIIVKKKPTVKYCLVLHNYMETTKNSIGPLVQAYSKSQTSLRYTFHALCYTVYTYPFRGGSYRSGTVDCQWANTAGGSSSDTRHTESMSHVEAVYDARGGAGLHTTCSSVRVIPCSLSVTVTTFGARIALHASRICCQNRVCVACVLRSCSR